MAGRIAKGSFVILALWLVSSVEAACKHGTGQHSQVKSCVGRCNVCDLAYPCQCNYACQSHNDCCADYHALCGGGTVHQTGSTGGSHHVDRADLSVIASALWKSDVNRLGPGDITTDYQGHTNDHSHTDEAPKPLFSHVNEARLQRPTFQKFQALLDNYNHHKGKAEVGTSQHSQEITAFLDEIGKTDVMKETMIFLNSKAGFSFASMSDYKNFLHSIWFDFYPRKAGHPADSSGFEHVFVGELEGNKVGGFHNWLEFYLQEKAGHLNYEGYIRTENPDIIATHFTWYGEQKGLSTFFIGTSPEFEMSLYTICYLTNPGHHCSFNIGPFSLAIQTWELDTKSGQQVASSYVI